MLQEKDIEHCGAKDENEHEYGDADSNNESSGSESDGFETYEEDEASETSSDVHEATEDDDGKEDVDDAVSNNKSNGSDDSDGFETYEEDEGSETSRDAHKSTEDDDGHEATDDADGYVTIDEEDDPGSTSKHSAKVKRPASKLRRTCKYSRGRAIVNKIKTKHQQDENNKSKKRGDTVHVKPKRDKDGLYLYSKVSPEERKRIYAELDAEIARMEKNGTWPKDFDDGSRRNYISWLPNELLGCAVSAFVGLVAGLLVKFYRKITDTETAPRSLDSNIVTDNGRYLKDDILGYPDWPDNEDGKWDEL